MEALLKAANDELVIRANRIKELEQKVEQLQEAYNAAIIIVKELKK